MDGEKIHEEDAVVNRKNVRIEADKLDVAKEILAKAAAQKVKLLLPQDLVMTR